MDNYLIVVEGRDGILHELDNPQSNESFDVTFAISDVSDISSRTGGFTRSITAPNTPRNRKAFNLVNDVNQETNKTGLETYWNFNAKNKCWIYNKDEEVFRGYIILERFDKLNNNFILTAVDFNSTLYTALNGKTMDQLDLSGLDHTWNMDTVEDSWFADESLGYAYPFIDYGKKYNTYDIYGVNAGFTQIWSLNRLMASSFFPAIYAKPLFIKIINEAGYDIEGSFIGNTTFNKMIIPLTNGTIPVGPTFSNDKVFKVSYQSGGFYGKQIVTALGSLTQNTKPGKWYGGANYTGTTFHGSVAPGEPMGIPLNFDDETQTFQIDNQDNNGLWDSTFGGVYTNKSNEVYNQRFTVNLEMYSVYPGYASQWITSPPYQTPPDFFQICFYREFDPLTGTTHPDWNKGLGFNIPMDHYNPYSTNEFYFNAEGWNNFVDTGDGSLEILSFQNIWYLQTVGQQPGFASCPMYRVSLTTANLDDRPDQYRAFRPLLPNERVRCLLRWKTQITGFIPKQSGPASTSVQLTNKLYILGGQINVSNFAHDPGPLGLDPNDIFVPNSNIYNTIGENLVLNGEVKFNNLMLNYKDMLQTDFLLAFIRLFNLYIESNKEYENLLQIDTRNDFYNNSNVYNDWSDKIDNKNIQDISYSLDKYKRTKFTYDSDSDYYNTAYQTEYKENFGTQIWELQETYFETENNIAIKFAPTPMIKFPAETEITASNFIYPYIAKEGDNDGFTPKMRLLLFKQNLLTFSLPGKTLPVYDYDATNRLRTYSGFPYAGYLDDPLYPNIDINFGPPRVQFYTSTSYTSNNMFQTYWKTHMLEIGGINARMITVNMDLTPSDIKNFKFSDIIILNWDGGTQYWRVNKIDKYSINSAEGITPCEVQLIKALDISAPDGGSIIRGFETSGIIRGNNQVGIGANILLPKYSNFSINQAPISQAPLTSNTSISNYSNVYTRQTPYAAPISMGNGSLVSAGGVNIGNYNQQYATTNVFTIGNNITVMPGISNQVIFDGAIVPYVNIVDAGGMDIVLPFDGKPGLPILIDGGYNEVLPMNSFSVINHIDGNFNIMPF